MRFTKGFVFLLTHSFNMSSDLLDDSLADKAIAVGNHEPLFCNR